MRLKVETLFPCSVETMWEAIQSTALLKEVSSPLLKLEAIPPIVLPERWTDISSGSLRIYLFGKLSLGVRTINLEFIDQDAHIIQTQEHDAVVKQWQHRMAVRPAPHGHCYYSDTVDIKAGASTVSTWLFAQLLYRHRHRQWSKVLKRIN